MELERLTDFKYKKDKVTKDWLRKRGFYYNKKLSDFDSSIYVRSYPAITYGTKPVIEFEVAVEFETGNVFIYVYELHNNERRLCPLYYNRQYGNAAPVINVIDQKIINTLENLKIKRIKEKRNERQNRKVRES